MKSNNSKIMGLMSAAALALGVQQAGAYQDVTDYDGSRDNGRAFQIVNSSITTDTTWSNNTVYVLDRLICVRAGATLTIQAGTVVRGLPVGSVASQPGSLLVSRGGKIIAVGTPTQPIVFTDMYDDNWGANQGTTVTIPAGVHATAGGSTNGTPIALTVDYSQLNNQLTGMWGGLLLAGRSYIAWDSGDSSSIYTPDGRIETTIEGITAGGEDTKYGGCNDLDNSGALQYVSCRYGGFVLGPTKEINGITFNGVGRNTQLDHIDVYQTKDDNVEFFGGCLNMKHLVTWNGCDDQLDTDTGWRGKVQFALCVQGYATNTDWAHGQMPDSSDKGLEWDGAGDSSGINDDPQSCGTLFNATMIGLGSNCVDLANNAFTIRDNAGGRLYNNIWMDFGGGCSLVEGVPNPNSSNWPFGTNCAAAKLTQAYGQDNYYLSGTNRQGILLSNGSSTNYIGYPDAYAPMNAAGVQQPSNKAEFKRNVFWNMGVPHSIGFINNDTNSSSPRISTGILYWGNDNKKYAQRSCYGSYPEAAGYDIVAAGNVGGNITLDNVGLPAPYWTLINYYERDTAVANFKPTFRDTAHPYTNVKKIDPRANTNFWSIIATYGVQPPADGFYTPVQFVGAMGKKNWAGPWSTAWRMGGFVTNNVPTGDETGIVPTITTGSGAVNISLATDTYAGLNADFWVVAIKATAPYTVYYYNLTTSRWVVGMLPTYQGALFDFAPFAISTSTLPTGSYTAYWGVDLNKNGTVDFDSLYAAGVPFTR
ncbi:MAG: hypothetical protein WCI20_01135 [bacterium]